MIGVRRSTPVHSLGNSTHPFAALMESGYCGPKRVRGAVEGRLQMLEEGTREAR